MATPDQLAAVRALIAGDFEQHEEIIGRLTAAGELDAYGTLLGAAQFLAVRRQFASGHTSADVIQLAADIRAVFDRTGDDTDPRPIELVARSALGEQDVTAQLDDKTVLTAQTLTVGALGAEHRLGEPDEFFREVQALAEKWGA